MHAVSKPDFDAWVQSMKTPTGAPAADASDDAKKGAQLVGQYGCVGCHTIDGNPLNANARVGRNLSHVASRTTFAAGILETKPENFARWVHDAPSVKQGVKMPSFADRMSDADANAIAAYLVTLK